MKRKLMAAFSRAVYMLGKRYHDGGITILSYHSIDDYTTGISVAPRLFEAQMATLASEGCSTLTMSEVAEHLAGCRSFTPRAVAITFDDGFANVLSLAAPVLARYGFSATVYAISGMVGRVTCWTAGGVALPSLPLLSWPQLRELQAAGIEIGAHSVTHAFLTQRSPGDLRRELQQSREALEIELGTRVRAFAYPQGDYNPAVVAATRAAGYSTAVTIDQGRAGLRSDPFRLPRLHVGGNSTPEVLRAFTVPAIGPAYRLVNVVIRGLMGRKTWPRPDPGRIQSTQTAGGASQ